MLLKPEQRWAPPGAFVLRCSHDASRSFAVDGGTPNRSPRPVRAVPWLSDGSAHRRDAAAIFAFPR
jgi:hypothetical protein